MQHPISLLFLLLAGLGACQSSPAEKQATTAPVVSALPISTDSAVARDTAFTDSTPAAVRAGYTYTVPPVDQTQRHPALRAFLQQVLRACAARQQADLLALVDDSVVVSMGGGIYGKPGFVTDFLNDPSHGSGFDRLQRVIRLGGTVAHDSAGQLVATFPYLQDEALYKGRLATLVLDPIISYVGTVPGLIIYSQPARRSQQIARLDYPILFSGYDAQEIGGEWLHVVAADNSFKGYAEAKDLYCLAAMTLTIEQKKGQFKITSVISFD